MLTAEAFTPNELPAPASVPEVAVSANQALLVEACQVTGRAQVPLSFTPTVSGAAVASPCASVRVSVPGEGGASTHGGMIVSVTVKVCVPPCTVTLPGSLAVMVTVVL